VSAAPIAQRETTVAGTRLAYLEAGRGPTVVLLHGFPDNAWTWEHQLEGLAQAGCHAVAPFLPGFPPSAVVDGELRMGDIFEPLAALLRELGGPVALVGHDWGATVSYQLAAAEPELLSCAAMLAVPHPAASGAVLFDPALVKENFHHWFFQLEGLPELAFETNDYAFVDFFWREWSVGEPEAAHLERLKRETFAQPGATAAAVGYYRAMYRAIRAGELTLEPITVPSLVVFGAQDPHRQLAAGRPEPHFSGEYRFELIDGAFHFLQREQPQALTDLLVDWVAAHQPSRLAS